MHTRLLQCYENRNYFERKATQRMARVKENITKPRHVHQLTFKSKQERERERKG